MTGTSRGLHDLMINGVAQSGFLPRIPESGIPRLSSHPTRYLIYVFPSNELARTKELEVLYSYGENEVRVHSVRFGTTQGDADEGQL